MLGALWWAFTFAVLELAAVLSPSCSRNARDGARDRIEGLLFGCVRALEATDAPRGAAKDEAARNVIRWQSDC